MSFGLVDLAVAGTGRHTWRATAPDSGTVWLRHLASRYRQIRTESQIAIQSVHFDGLSFDATHIKRRLAEAVLPARSSGPLAVARSDFGEVIATCILEEVHATRFGYQALRDREIANRPGRGIDTIGVEKADHGPLRLVLGETKTSADPASPPRAVDGDDTSLRGQHLAHLANLDETCRKVFDAARRAWDRGTQELLFAAALLMEARDWGRLEMVAFCCLVRQEDRYSEGDYGSFKASPEDFAPCSIRFVIFCVPGDDIELAVSEWLELAREGD